MQYVVWGVELTKSVRKIINMEDRNEPMSMLRMFPIPPHISSRSREMVLQVDDDDSEAAKQRS